MMRYAVLLLLLLLPGCKEPEPAKVLACDLSARFPQDQLEQKTVSMTIGSMSVVFGDSPNTVYDARVSRGAVDFHWLFRDSDDVRSGDDGELDLVTGEGELTKRHLTYKDGRFYWKGGLVEFYRLKCRHAQPITEMADAEPKVAGHH
jgi:hypothetical protein